jgi:putative ABC transport system ATP-binding protein
VGEIMLTLRDLVAGYGETLVARLPWLSLESGQAALLLGPSGVGKTSLLLAIAGLARIFAGDVEVDDQNLARLDRRRIQRFRAAHIGFVFQDLHLVTGLSVLDNVLLAPFASGRAQDRDRARSLLERLGLGEAAKRPAETLSRGQAQRVAIARALLQTPRLILADEPTASLDDSACERVADLLLEGARESGAALLVATHDQRLRARIGQVVEVEAMAPQAGARTA